MELGTRDPKFPTNNYSHSLTTDGLISETNSEPSKFRVRVREHARTQTKRSNPSMYMSAGALHHGPLHKTLDNNSDKHLYLLYESDLFGINVLYEKSAVSLKVNRTNIIFLIIFSINTNYQVFHWLNKHNRQKQIDVFVAATARNNNFKTLPCYYF